MDKNKNSIIIKAISVYLSNVFNKGNKAFVFAKFEYNVLQQNSQPKLALFPLRVFCRHNLSKSAIFSASNGRCSHFVTCIVI